MGVLIPHPHPTMKSFQVTVSYEDPYPKSKTYRSEATEFSSGVSRALKMFRKDNKSCRIKHCTIVMDDLGKVDNYTEAEDYLPDEVTKMPETLEDVESAVEETEPHTTHVIQTHTYIENRVSSLFR